MAVTARAGEFRVVDPATLEPLAPVQTTPAAWRHRRELIELGRRYLS